MKIAQLNATLLTLCTIAMMGCSPSASQLQKVVEENPEVVFSAIEKHPDKFMQTVIAAQQKARQMEEEKFRNEESNRREEEFKNPKVPEIAADRAVKGNKSAPVTIVEYSDFQCPFCRRGHMTVSQVLKDYPDKVRLVFKNFPIERIHPHALKASQYFEAIALQDADKAYKFQSIVFENQEDLGQKGEAFLKDAAKKVGANMDKVKTDIAGETVKKRIDADRAEAEKFGFSGTPGYLINGVSLKGAYPVEEFKAIIDKHLAANK